MHSTVSLEPQKPNCRAGTGQKRPRRRSRRDAFALHTRSHISLEWRFVEMDNQGLVELTQVMVPLRRCTRTARWRCVASGRGGSYDGERCTAMEARRNFAPAPGDVFVCWSASAVSSPMEFAGFLHHGHCEGANFLFQRKWWEPGLCAMAVEKPVCHVD